MRPFLLTILLMLPLLATVQNGRLTSGQSKVKMDALAKIEREQTIVYFIDSYNLAVVLKDDHYGVVAIDGHVVLPTEYSYITFENEVGLFGLFKDSENGVGFADHNGRLVLPFEFSGEYFFVGRNFFTNGMMSADRNGKFGIIDTAGRTVVPYVYDDRIEVCSADGKLMYVHSGDESSTCLLRFNGDTVIGPAYWMYNILSDSERQDRKPIFLVCRILDGAQPGSHDTLHGLYDGDGREIMPCRYNYVSTFHDGKAVVLKKGVGFGIIDINGREVVPCSGNLFHGEILFPLTSGLLVNYLDDRCGVIDTKGNVVIPHEYSYYVHDTRERIALSDTDDRLYIFDTKGNLTARYDEVYDFEESPSGFPVRNKGGKWGFLDNNLRLSIPMRYKDITQLDKNVFSVLLDDGQRGLIDTTGRMLFHGPYHSIERVCDGIFRVYSFYNTDNDRETTPYISGFIDLYGNTTLTDKETERMKHWKERHEHQQ